MTRIDFPQPSKQNPPSSQLCPVPVSWKLIAFSYALRRCQSDSMIGDRWQRGGIPKEEHAPCKSGLSCPKGIFDGFYECWRFRKQLAVWRWLIERPSSTLPSASVGETSPGSTDFPCPM